MPGPFAQIVDFLISTLLGLYVILLLLRLLFAFVRVDFYNPLSQSIVRLTNPPLHWLHRVLPTVGKVDLGVVFLAFVLKFLELWLRMVILGIGVEPFGLILVTLRELLVTMVWILIISLIIEVVLSWLQTGTQIMRNPMAHLVLDINRPLLSRVRRVLPNTGGLDFSPMVALILLYVVLILVRAL
jgi:YggT family protein